MTLDDFSPEFRRYLEYKGTKLDENISPEILNSIYSDNVGRFEIWDKLPEALKNRYKAEVPQDVMEAAARDEYLTLREMEYHPEIKYAEDARTRVEEKYDMIPDDITGDLAKAAFVGAIIAGYSQDASAELARNRQIRENLTEKALNGTLTDEEQEKWDKSRRADHETIKREWSESTPEKLLVHVLSDFNRGKITQEEVIPMVADLMQKIHNEGRQQNLLEYMQKGNIQAKLSRFNDGVLELLETSVMPKVSEIQQQQSLRTLAENIRVQKEKRQVPKTTLAPEAIRNQLSGLER